jgi:hypothetical protein
MPIETVSLVTDPEYKEVDNSGNLFLGTGFTSLKHQFVDIVLLLSG